MEESPKFVGLPEFNENRISDRFNFVYIVILLAGIGSVLPWNFFITAQGYFDYKLKNPNLAPGQDYRDTKYMTREQVLFGSYTVVCSMLPLAIFIILNYIIMKWLPAFKRYIAGVVILIAMFLLTVILVNVDLEISVFLGITLTSVAIINAGTAFIQGSIFGVAAVLPAKYMKAACEGQAISGVMASVANLITIAAASSPLNVGLSYFLIALCYMAILTALYLMLPRNSFFSYFWLAKDVSSFDKGEESVSETKQSGNPFAKLGKSMKEVHLPGLCIMGTLFLTLSLFPAVLSRLQPAEPDLTDLWKGTYFIPVAVFLFYNICDWLGRFIAGFTRWPRRNQMQILLSLTAARLTFIPIVLLCNVQPRTRLPVVFNHDSIPIILNILMALTNGYLVNVAMMHAPTFASPGNAEGAGIAITIYSIMGLLTGVAVSAGFVALL